jgi:hypothetical protein
VLLLDEIEKAHHEVFNLLLQLLGDGRLTDSRGRTADFTQTIVIMTSNLGVREASKPLGLRAKAGEEGLTYRRAVEQFFPPELFNRLDRVVPFARLSRDDTKVLAQRLLSKVLSREGLVRRQCLLRVSPQAMEKIVDLGFHPHLGARALKRSIESSISAPVSARLTEIKPQTPTVISIEAGPDLLVRVRELTAAPRRTGGSLQRLSLDYLQSVKTYLDSRERALSSPGGLVGEELTSAQIWYYSVQDRLRRTRAILGRLESYLDRKDPPKRRLETSHSLLQAADWQGVLETGSLSLALKDLSATLPVRTEERRLAAKFAELMAELPLLEGQGDDEQAVLELAFGPSDKAWGKLLFDLYKSVFGKLELQVEGALSDSQATLQLTGPHAKTLVASEQGIHLFAGDHGLGLVEALGSHWVVRVYDKQHGSLDLRSGWMCLSLPEAGDMEYMMLCSLPTALELEP